MGDSISKLNDDYDAYISLCEQLGIIPYPFYKSSDTSWIDHEEELTKKHELYKTYWGTYKQKEK